MIRNWIIGLFFVLIKTSLFAQGRLYSEKVFLHVDKPAYVAGDTIWFQGYVLEAVTHTLQPQSEILHVTLTDSEGESIDEKIYRIDGGVVSGYFPLSANLQNHAYQLNAFTYALKAFGEEYFYQIRIPIINFGTRKYIEQQRSTADASIGPSMQCDNKALFAGEVNNLLVEFRDKLGDLHGDTLYIMDDQGVINKQVIEEEQSLVVSVLPRSDRVLLKYTYKDQECICQYRVKEKKSARIKNLIKEDSYNLYISTSNPTPHVLRVSYYDSEIIAHRLVGKELYRLDIPFEALLPGRISFALYDEAGTLLVEESMLHRESKISIETSRDTIPARSRMSLEIKNVGGSSVIASLGIYKSTPVSTYYHANKDFEFYLDRSSEYRTYDGIFRDHSDSGDFSQMIFPNDSAKARNYVPEGIGFEKKYLIIEAEGDTRDDPTNTYFSVLGDSSFMICDDFTTLEDFGSYIPIGDEHAYYYLSTNLGAISYQKVKMKPFDQFETINDLYGGASLDDISTYHKEVIENRLIEEAYLGKIEGIESDQRVKLSHFSTPDYTVSMDKYIQLNDLAEVDFEIMLDMKFREKDGKTYAYTELQDSITGNAIRLHDDPALLLFNGVPVVDATPLMKFPHAYIDSISVNHTEIDYYGQNVGGVVEIFTSDPVGHIHEYLNREPEIIPELIEMKDVKQRGLSPSIPFVSERVLWKPGLTFSDSMTVEFETPDIPGEYTIELQGITSNGQPITVYRNFVVVGDYN